MDSFEKKAYGVLKILGRIGSIILFLDMCFIIINIIARSFFNAPFFGSTEIVRYFAMVGGALAIAVNQYDDGNIKVTLVLEMLSAKARDVLAFIAELVLTGGFGLITYYLFMYMMKLQSKGDATLDLKLPTWIFLAILAIGFLLMTLANLMKTVVRGRCLAKKINFEEHKKKFMLENSPGIGEFTIE